MLHDFSTRLKEVLSLSFFCLVFLVLSYTQCAGFQKIHPRQAVLIVLDAARPDHFSCYGYGQPTTPVMDKLAETGARFLNVYSQGLNTRTALPCLLYSRFFAQPVFPNHHSIPFASPDDLFRRVDGEAVSIPQALEKADFLTAAIVAHEWITEETKFAREFQELYNLHTIVDFEKKYAYPRVDKVIDFTMKWLDFNREKDFFLYVHIMDTHFPHFFEDDAKFFFGEGEYDKSLFAPWGLPVDPNADFSEGDIRYLNALYDGSLRYTDRHIGRLVDFLGKSRMLDGMLLVITADHGEFLLDRKGMISHAGNWYDPVARIPLIIHFPEKVKPQVRSTVCGLVDVGPTVLGLLGTETPEGKRMDGVDLLDTTGTRRTQRKRQENQEPQAAFIGMGCTGLRTERFKCLFNWPAVRLLGDSAPA